MSYEEYSHEESEASLLLRRLVRLTPGLRLNAWSCALIALSNFLLTMLAGLLAGSSTHISSDFAGVLVLAAFLVALLSLFLLFLFDQRRQLGDAIFQELSDELEWSPYKKNGAPRFSASSAPENADLPRATVRLAIREFLLASTLPLAEREGSVRIYFLVNILSSVSAVVLIVLATKASA